MTILEALNWGQEQLKQTADEKREASEPMGDAQILLATCLKKPTAYLFSHFEDALPVSVIEQFQRYIERRKRHEPIAYILQTKSFYGRAFHVNPFVLVPRPETESLIELAKELATEISTIIDVGTGSGAIAISLAAELHQPVIAIDIDPQALSVAKKNARVHGVDHQISFLHGNLLDPIRKQHIQDANQPHTLILANLPYLSPTQWSLTDPDVQDYEPRHALVSGIDGLEHYDQLLEHVTSLRDHLAHTVDLILEIDPSQAQPLVDILRTHLPAATAEVITDLTNRERFLHIRL